MDVRAAGPASYRLRVQCESTTCLIGLTILALLSRLVSAVVATHPIATWYDDMGKKVGGRTPGSPRSRLILPGVKLQGLGCSKPPSPASFWQVSGLRSPDSEGFRAIVVLVDGLRLSL